VRSLCTWYVASGGPWTQASSPPASPTLSKQLLGVGACGTFTILCAWILFSLTRALMGLRVDPQEETEGLDYRRAQHPRPRHGSGSAGHPVFPEEHAGPAGNSGVPENAGSPGAAHRTPSRPKKQPAEPIAGVLAGSCFPGICRAPRR